MSRRALDPDYLAALEEERDFLLRSIDDLEAEYRAGDLDAHDFNELKDDYTVRAAEVIRSIDDIEVARNRARQARGEGRGIRRALWTVGVLAGAVLAGVLLARTVGERGVGDSLTGSIDESLRDRVRQCQMMGVDQWLEAIDCFDRVLDEDPRNVEALAYRGWYVGLVGLTAQEQNRTEQAEELLATSRVHLDRAIEIDDAFPDARAFRAVIAERQGDPALACADLVALADLRPPPMMEQLTASLFERLDC